VKHFFAHRQPACRTTLSWGWTCFLSLFLVCTLRASDLLAPFTLELPIPANQALPAWLGQPETPATTFATLNLPILSPDSTSSLLVTVYFQEKPDGFLRISWQGTQGAQLLSDNFYENIGMSNQRSLLISPSTLIGDGTLTFQCGDSTLGIQRIRFEWLVNKDGLVSPDVVDYLVTPVIGASHLSEDFNGQANLTQPGAWQGQIVTVPMTDEALRIEEGVEFSVDLDKVPVSARLAFKEAGLPMGKRLVVWINQQRAGTITPSVPDLLDNGFVTDSDTSTSYVGWRDGSFYAPVSLLKPGVNTLLFSDEDDADSTSDNSGAAAFGPGVPLAMKAFVLQLNYVPPAPVKADPSLPQFSMPTGPISPTETPSTPPETNTP